MRFHCYKALVSELVPHCLTVVLSCCHQVTMGRNGITQSAVCLSVCLCVCVCLSACLSVRPLTVVCMSVCCRWPATMGLLSLMALSCLALLVGVIRHSRCLLIT